MPRTLYTPTTCLEHAQHLIALSALKAADRCLSGFRTWHYYASLATTCNVCRDVSKELFSAWCAEHGLESAKQHAKTLFPKACSSRWSGCDKPESRFLQCGESRLKPILLGVLEKRKDQKSQSRPVIDEIAIEESKAYSEKLGRWRKRTALSISDPLWWKCVQIVHLCRSPLTHLTNFLKKRADEWSHIPQLCTGKAAIIRDEFTKVWLQLVETGCLDGEENDKDVQFARNLAPLGM